MLKVWIVLIGVLLSFSTAFGQYSEKEEGLHSRYRPGIMWFFSGLQPHEEGKLRKYDRLILDLTYNDWHGDQKAFHAPWNSIGFNAAFMFDIPFTKGNTVGMGVGLGYSYFNNRTKMEFQRDFDQQTTHLAAYDEQNEPLKAQFGANYLEIPLELRFRTKGYQHFKFLIGAKIGYRLNSFSKETQRIEGKKYKTKHLNFPDANPLRYGVTARIGMRNWALYGAYYFSPLFKEQQSVQLFPFELGISVALF